MTSTSINKKSLEGMIDSVEAADPRKDMPEIRPGSTVAVHQRILEKGKVRTQIFEGVVLKSVRRAKLGASILVRKTASGVGVERTFFMNSPLIEKVEVKKLAKVRRAKLFYLRGLSGRSAVMREARGKQAEAAPQASA